MGMDVDCLLLGKCSVADALERLPRALRANGFRQCGRVWEIAFDPYDGIFVDAEYVGELGQVAAEDMPAEELTGQAVDYDDEDLYFCLQVAGPREGYVNAFVSTSDSLFGSGQAERYFDTIRIVSQAIDALGGYGGIELFFKPLAPEAVASTIRRGTDPQHPEPPFFAVASRELGTRRFWQAELGYEYRVSMLSADYLLLVEDTFDELFLESPSQRGEDGT